MQVPPVAALPTRAPREALMEPRLPSRGKYGELFIDDMPAPEKIQRYLYELDLDMVPRWEPW